eukprot:4691815-Pleurochrysis_carterae.AAC.1
MSTTQLGPTPRVGASWPFPTSGKTSSRRHDCAPTRPVSHYPGDCGWVANRIAVRMRKAFGYRAGATRLARVRGHRPTATRAAVLR